MPRSFHGGDSEPEAAAYEPVESEEEAESHSDSDSDSEGEEEGSEEKGEGAPLQVELTPVHRGTVIELQRVELHGIDTLQPARRCPAPPTPPPPSARTAGSFFLLIFAENIGQV